MMIFNMILFNIDDDDISDSSNLYKDEDVFYDEFDNIFYEMVENCLKSHNINNNNDEFKIYNKIFKFIKNNDENFFNDLLLCFNQMKPKSLNSLIAVRNIKIEYNGKKVDIPIEKL